MRSNQKISEDEYNVSAALKKRFTEGLLKWNQEHNDRTMPWKGEKDAYKIWLSEIILQQTRVEQGLSYYQKFVKAFPTIQHLAHAPQQQVYKLWEGLGYYSRCKNLMETATYISEDLDGIFPDQYEDILQLKGVGSYTAAAIASFAYNLPYAVLDGNVFRILARIAGIETPVDTTEGKKVFANLAQQLLPKKQAAIYNQAIMDFGATVCKPAPECAHCFFNKHCRAFIENKQQLLPVKLKRTKVKERWFNYAVLQHQHQYAILQRTGKDIWQGLYEFLLLETDAPSSLENVLSLLYLQHGLSANHFVIKSFTTGQVQKLSHQKIHFSFIAITLSSPVSIKNLSWISRQQLADYPFPKTLHQYVAAELL